MRMWILLILIPIVFTAAGWRKIIIPYGFPVVKFLWTLLAIVIWTGFSVAVLNSGTMYRTFGINGWEIIGWVANGPEGARQMRWHAEDTTNLAGRTEPHWRAKHHLKPLPKDWDGRGEHSLPMPFAILIPVAGYAVILIRRWRRSKDDAQPNEVDDIGSQSPRPHIRELQRTIRSQTVFAEPALLSIDNNIKSDFKLALKGLGYRESDIGKVLVSCAEGTLEDRVKRALRLLQTQA